MNQPVYPACPRASAAIRIICAAAAACMGLVSVLVYGASVPGFAVMTAFMLFYVQLPGVLVFRALDPAKKHVSTMLSAGFFTGWIICIILYFLSDLIGTFIPLIIAGPLLSACFILQLIRKPSGSRAVSVPDTIRSIPASFCIFIVLILLYCLVNTQYLYLDPDLSDYVYLNADKAYHMGLINSLSHDYPLQSPWVSGIFINYHIFTEILFSIPVRLFGMHADFITQSFGPFLTAYVFGLSLYSFYREMSSRPERAGIYCLITVLANFFPARSARASMAFAFVLTNDNSSGYGIAAVLVSVVLMRRWYQSFDQQNSLRRPDHWKALLLLTAFVMLTTGIKGPMGAVMAGGMWGTVLLGIILRKMPLRSILPLSLVTAGFAFIYLTVLGSKGQSNASGESFIKFGTITDVGFWKKPLILFLKSHGVPSIARLAAILLVFAILFTTVFFLPVVIGYIRELLLVISGKKVYEPARVLVYAESAVGFIAMFLLNYSGHSQIYFGLVTAFLVPMIAFWFMEDMEEESSKSHFASSVLRAVGGIAGLSLVITTVLLGSYYIHHIEDAYMAADPHSEYNRYISISNDEYDAMEWINENTEEDALLASDRYYSVSLKDYSYDNRWANRFFMYPVYSNRFTYISGSGYNIPTSEWRLRRDMIETNKKLYDADYADRGDLARELDIDYVVVSKRFTDAGDLSCDDYELCFSNDDVEIYRINDAA